MTIRIAKRLPRKLKKKIIKEFGRGTYYDLIKNPNVIYQAKIISYLTDKGFVDRYEGHSIFFSMDIETNGLINN